MDKTFTFDYFSHSFPIVFYFHFFDYQWSIGYIYVDIYISVNWTGTQDIVQSG